MKESLSALLKLLRITAPDATKLRGKGFGCDIYQLEHDALDEAASALHSAGGFDTLETIIACDPAPLNENGYLLALGTHPRHPKETPAKLELTYIFSSSSGGTRAALRTVISQPDLKAPSLSSIYPAADLPEREIHDLYGVAFTGRETPRLLAPDNTRGYPLRRGYTHEPDLLDGQ